MVSALISAAILVPSPFSLLLNATLCPCHLLRVTFYQPLIPWTAPSYCTSCFQFSSDLQLVVLCSLSCGSFCAGCGTFVHYFDTHRYRALHTISLPVNGRAQFSFLYLFRKVRRQRLLTVTSRTLKLAIIATHIIQNVVPVLLFNISFSILQIPKRQ